MVLVRRIFTGPKVAWVQFGAKRTDRTLPPTLGSCRNGSALRRSDAQPDLRVQQRGNRYEHVLVPSVGDQPDMPRNDIGLEEGINRVDDA